MSASLPGASTPMSSKPSTRAPFTVAHRTTSSTVVAPDPFAARCVCQALCISLIMSADSFEAAPSTASDTRPPRAEEHTSELQSPDHLVCRLLLEKKKTNHTSTPNTKRNKSHINIHNTTPIQ